MTHASRGSLGWLGMVLAGLALGAYVFAAWPDAAPNTPAASPQPVRVTASVDAYPERELGGVAGAFYHDELFAYELGPTPFLDAVIAAPPAVDAG